MVSVMPSAVSGLTKQEAPSAALVPSGSGRHSLTRSVRYCAYIAPPIIPTVLPISAFAASDDPVLITAPAPSLPTGMDSSSRAAIAFIAASGPFAVITGASLVPEALAVVMSAAPISSPRSDGLIGDASTRTTTSSGPGSGVGTLARDISSSPLFLISERSCSPVLLSELMRNLPVSALPNLAGSVLTLAGKRKPDGHVESGSLPAADLCENRVACVRLHAPLKEHADGPKRDRCRPHPAEFKTSSRGLDGAAAAHRRSRLRLARCQRYQV